MVFGNGSCELLMLLGEAFLGPGRHMPCFPHPSFVMYRQHRPGARRAASPRCRSATWTTTSRPCWRRCGTTRAFLSSAIPTTPPAATSSRPSCARSSSGCRADVAVVLDEAYGEFVTARARQTTPSRWLDRVPQSGHPADVLEDLRPGRTARGLRHRRPAGGAGARQGAPAVQRGLARPGGRGESLRLPGAHAASGSTHGRAESGRASRSGWPSMGVAYHPERGELHAWWTSPSLAIPGRRWPRPFWRRGVLTRSGYAMECPGWIRVTIGEAEENDMFLAAMAELRGSHATQLDRTQWTT